MLVKNLSGSEDVSPLKMSTCCLAFPLLFFIYERRWLHPCSTAWLIHNSVFQSSAAPPLLTLVFLDDKWETSHIFRIFETRSCKLWKGSDMNSAYILEADLRNQDIVFSSVDLHFERGEIDNFSFASQTTFHSSLHLLFRPSLSPVPRNFHIGS